MSDQGRETLPSEAVITAMADTWAERTGIAEKLKTVPNNLPTEEMQQRHDALVLRHVKLSYEEGVATGWRAARDQYAPKLTEKEAVEAAARAIDATAKEDFRGGIEYNAAAFAKAALRAAGLRFKDEASSNPEPGASR